MKREKHCVLPRNVEICTNTIQTHIISQLEHVHVDEVKAKMFKHQNKEEEVCFLFIYWSTWLLVRLADVIKQLQQVKRMVAK